MPETLWVTLPTNEENKLKAVISSIGSKNLTNLSINQLIEKLDNSQAAGWLEVLSQYNAIPSIRNMNTSQMRARAISVKSKFKQRGYEQLENREFQPNQLLSLVILCYSNPNLIGPKLCRALNDNNVDNIKKEILENSARVGDRVVPWASNLRLANYAFFANDTAVQLPQGVLTRIREGARNNNITLVEVGGSPEIDVRSSRDDRSINGEVNRTIHPPLQANANTGPMLISGPSSEHNAANFSNGFSNGNDLIIGGWALFQIARNTPVGTIFGNIARDLATATGSATEYIGSFFSSKAPALAEQVGQKTFLSSVAKP